MSRMKFRTSKMKFLATAIALLAGCLTAPIAAAQTTPLTSFTISTNLQGTTYTIGNSITVNISLTGGTASGPSGNVDLFVSNSNQSSPCSVNTTNIGTYPLTVSSPVTSGGNYTAAANPSFNSLLFGYNYLCATYIPDTNSIYASSTAASASQLNVVAPLQSDTATLNVSPTAFVAGQNVNVSATIAPASSTDAGVPSGGSSAYINVTDSSGGGTIISDGSALFAAPGNGSFVPINLNPSVNVSPARVLSADINLDNYTDIVAMPGIPSGQTQAPAYLQLFLSNQANGFLPEQDVNTGCSPQDFAVGDINRDGKPDLVVLCAAGSPSVAMYMLGNGNGTFQSPQTLISTTTLSSSSNIVLGDFNGDGFMDVALLDGKNDVVQEFTGSSTFGTFTGQTQEKFDSANGGVVYPAVADFNQDGKSDIAVAQPTSKGYAILDVLISNGNGSFAGNTTQFNTPATSLGLAITNANGNNYPDIAIADPGNPNNSDTGKILLFVDPGNGGLTNPPLTYDIANPQSITGLPFPVVGTPTSTITQPWSIFFSTYDLTTKGVTLTGLNLTNGQLGAIYSGLGADYYVGTSPQSALLTTGNFNGEQGFGDGYYDVAIATTSAATGGSGLLMPFYYTNSSAHTFAPSILSGLTPGAYTLTAGYDGDNIYAAATSTNVPVTVYSGTATGILTVPSTAPYGQSITVSASITGSATGPAPTGTVDFYVNGSDYTGPVSLVAGTSNSATATTSFYPPAASNTPYSVTAVYNGDTAYNYAPLTLGPSPLTVLYPTTLTAIQQNNPVAGQPVSLQISLTTPTGQPAPTGAITVTDLAGNTLATATATATGISPNPVSVNLGSGTNYNVNYGGDPNYIAQSYFGTAYFANALVSTSPTYILTGSPDTTITVNGNAFTSTSVVQITNAQSVVQTLATTFVNADQLTAVVPTAQLTTAQMDTVQVVTGGVTSNSVNLDIYTPQATTNVATATPSTFVYGQAGTVNFGASVAPASSGEAGLPTGSVNFTLSSQAAVSAPVTLGSATLAANGVTGSTGSTGSTASLVQGSFGTPFDNYPTKAVSADLTGNGLTDVISKPAGGDIPSSYLQVFLSTKINGFQSELTVPTGCGVQDFAVGDINGDGIPDIVVLCSSTSGNVVATYLLGNGDGTFQSPVTLISSTSLQSPDNILLGDFNGDGAMDVALITLNAVQVYTGSKTFGTFTPLTSFSFSSAIGGSIGITPAAVADFNQDGKSDIVFLTQPYQATPLLVQLTSNGDGTFGIQTQTVSTTASYFSTGPIVTDVNGDGYPDVVVADPGLSGTADTGGILVFENNGSGALNALTEYPVTNPQAVAGISFPVIGKPAASAITQPATIFFNSFLSTGEIDLGGLSVSGTTFNLVYPPQPAGYDITTYGGADLVVAGDMNGDGYYDAAVASVPTTASFTANLLPFYYTNSSSATLTGITQQPNAGSYNLTATYTGSTTFATSTSTTVPITITQALPGVGLTPSATVVSYGQSVTYTATITGVTGGTVPSGSVTFNVTDVSNTSIGTATVTLVPVAGTNSATATYTFDTLNTAYPYASPFTATATYSGDNNYQGGILATAPLTVNDASLNLSLTSSATTVTADTVVTFTVNATSSAGGLPSGEYVTFTGLPTGSGFPTLDANGQAVYRFGLLSPGTYNVSVNYASDGVFSSANSNTIVLTVNPAPVQVSLASSANPVTYPTPVNVTATVSGGGLGVPTGTVSFANNGTALGSGTLAVVNGSGGLYQTAAFDASTTSNVVGEAIGDFNHDGKPDVAVLESTGVTSTLLVSLGNGDGTFQPAVSYAIPTAATGIAAADFNGDGYTDLAITDSAGNTYIYLANSTGTGALTLSQTLAGPPQSGYTPSNIAVATGDFNKDGHPDLAVLTSSYVLVYLNNGSGNFSGTAPVMYGTISGNQYQQYTGIAVADFNKDGYPDIALSTNVPSDGFSATGSSVTLLTNTGATAPGFSTASYPVASGATGIVAGDFNGDGYPDLAVLSGGDSTVDILINQAGAFPANTSYATVGEPVGMAVADFNKDGHDDLAISGVAGGAGGGTTILYGSASGVISTTALLPTAYGYADAAADLNGDGNPDLLVGNTQVTTFIDSAAQTTLSNVVLPAGSNPLTGAYTPDTTSASFFASGTSPAYTETVNQATPIVTWATPAPIVYGTALSAAQLNATASVPGTFTYTPAAGTVLTGGSHLLTVLFQPTSSNYAPVSASVTITVTQATPVVTWATPAPIYYGIPLSSTQLNATASVPGAFVYTPPAGTVLAIGQHTLSVLFTPTDTVDYSTATATVTLVVQPGSILSSILPTSANLGDPATTITLSGAGFLPSSVAQLNGTALATTYVSPTSLTAVIPASDLTTVQTDSITVLTTGEPVSSAVQFNVLAPTAVATFTGPSTAQSGSQPTLNFQFSQAYPVPVTATFTLSDSPANAGGIIDPAVQFASGGTTYTVVIPANSSAPVPVQLQTGTLAATITVTAQLSAGGVDITPSTLAPVVIQVPSSAPVISSVSMVRSGTTLTVTVQGFSSTRDVQSAFFHFSGVNGSTIANPDVTVQVNSPFVNWYSQTVSDQYGSAFSYVQTFNLTQDASTIGSVSVTLTNSVGASNTESAQ